MQGKEDLTSLPCIIDVESLRDCGILFIYLPGVTLISFPDLTTPVEASVIEIK
jgi:hypothetical protein